MSEIVCPVADHAQRDPDAAALLGPSSTYSYGELNASLSAVAKNLRAAGVRRGDIVALCLAPCAEYPVLLLGVIRLGAIAFPLNPHVPPAGILSALHTVRCSYVIAGGDLATLGGDSGIRVLAPHALLDAQHSIRPRLERVTTDRPAVIVLTSGSTGHPKAAVLTYGNLYANARASNANLPVSAGDRWLLSLPMYHVSGLGVIFRCIAAGAAIVATARHEVLMDCVPRYSVSHVSLVATQLVRALQDATAAPVLSRLKGILLGGSALPAGLLQSAVEAGLPIYITYGLTEMASQVATSRLTALESGERPSAHVLIPGSVRTNKESEIEVTGPTLFRGYLRNDAVSLALTEDGWFRTGDLGRLDARGGLTVLGRKDSLFISGGENIQPEEIERSLCGVEGVVQAIVVPVADAEFGHRPVAFVEMAPGRPMEPTFLIDALAEVLPRYKIPRTFFAWGEELAGQTLKLNRRNLAQRAEHLIHRT